MKIRISKQDLSKSKGRIDLSKEARQIKLSKKATIALDEYIIQSKLNK